jgi:hypothetical protein
MARDDKTKKNCDLCKKFRDTNSFLAGAQVYIDGLGDCATCEVTNSQPSADNQIIIDLYDQLPKSFDGWTGMLQVSAGDIMHVLEVAGIPRERHDDYFMRIAFFHEQLLAALSKRQAPGHKTDAK